MVFVEVYIYTHFCTLIRYEKEVYTAKGKKKNGTV